MFYIEQICVYFQVVATEHLYLAGLREIKTLNPLYLRQPQWGIELQILVRVCKIEISISIQKQR